MDEKTKGEIILVVLVALFLFILYGCDSTSSSSGQSVWEKDSGNKSNYWYNEDAYERETSSIIHKYYDVDSNGQLTKKDNSK